MDDEYQKGRRAVVTGVGVVSPIGCTKEVFWESLVRAQGGISALGPSSSDDETVTSGARIQEFRGRIKDFDCLDPAVEKRLRKALKVMNRETQLAVAAAEQAVSDSHLADSGLDPERIGVSFGTGNVPIMPEDFINGIQACGDRSDGFDFDRWGTDGIPQVAPLWLLKCLPNMPACHVAICNDLRGPNNSITQREVAANLAVAEAWHSIAEGDADAFVVGATGTTILSLNHMHSLMEQDVAPAGIDPTGVCRPFDRRRCGFVVGEGAAAILLEDWESATRRGVPIYGEVVGAGSSCVLDRSHTPQCDAALANAMRAALHTAELTPAELGHIHAHGLSTQRSDIEESRAIRNVLGASADTVPVVAAKSYLGNAGAGAGILELVASLLAIKHGRLFPILNFDQPDPECPITPVTSSDVEAGNSFLNLSMAPHGQASCLAIRAVA